MTNEKAIELIEKVKIQLDTVVIKELKKKNYEYVLEALAAKARILYLYNQQYKDDFIENKLIDISLLTHSTTDKHLSNKKTVLFYDGFGLDLRGLAYIYIKALSKLGYRIIYVSMAKDKNSQPYIMDLLNNADIYIIGKVNNKIKRLNLLRKIFLKQKFSYAFYYTYPDDVCAAIAFFEIAETCKRFQINLTDHAFWVGINAFDYSIEFRDYGASISYYYRNISNDKLLELPYYPITKNIKFAGFPFVKNTKKIIFSGGSLYKTIDKNNTFYRLVEEIIKRNNDVIFWYAGKGDDRYIKKLSKKYPKRVCYTKERNDLVEVLKHSYLYLNTYPIGGALMLQYAALAECIPVTLRRAWDDDALGILKNEEDLKETYSEFDEVISEINRLLTDANYYKSKKVLLKNSVISEKEFTYKLHNILLNSQPPEKFKNLIKVNTMDFIKSYKENITEEAVINALLTKTNYKIFKYFKLLLIKKMFYKIKAFIDC